jgi:hypothetical protein
MLLSSQTAIFNFESLLLVILLVICTCTYARGTAPGLVDRNKSGCVHEVFTSFKRVSLSSRLEWGKAAGRGRTAVSVRGSRRGRERMLTKLWRK